jgi:cbb3-type cytochrome oxidase maturation protein
MLPSSLTVSLSITVLGLLSVVAFLWAWFSGQFDDIERQGMIPLDDDDMNVLRPWETAAQRAAREARFGPSRPAGPGAWGGRS